MTSSELVNLEVKGITIASESHAPAKCHCNVIRWRNCQSLLQKLHLSLYTRLTSFRSQQLAFRCEVISAASRTYECTIETEKSSRSISRSLDRRVMERRWLVIRAQTVSLWRLAIPV